ncbi:unnamed protein product [Linum tenue]|uniref:Glycoside hydrolase family 3 N-terminal domain-containing protein n=1 Tax=Linum tenue TaxID=586396 RepID=A0AAV0LFT5_9ROSI|nr:unnamed protein product [Linum tenue]
MSWMIVLDREPALVKKIGAATALEMRATGIPYAFAPCIAVCRDPRWGRCYESYSEDSEIVKAMTELIPGLQGDVPADARKGVPYVAGKRKVAACAKHFVGDGGTVKGINENNTIIDWNGLRRIHMPAYFASIVKGVSTVMVSYSSWNGVRMHANRNLVTSYLKDTLKFRYLRKSFTICNPSIHRWMSGFVISDWQGIDRLTDPPHANYTYSVEKAVAAGLDMVMVPLNYTEFIDDLTLLVNKGFELEIHIIIHALATFKQEHRELAREAVRKSLVLLKNGKDGTSILPLPKKAPKILVAGYHAHNLGYQCGGWTIEWEGFSGNDRTPGT